MLPLPFLPFPSLAFPSPFLPFPSLAFPSPLLFSSLTRICITHAIPCHSFPFFFLLSSLSFLFSLCLFFPLTYIYILAACVASASRTACSSWTGGGTSYTLCATGNEGKNEDGDVGVYRGKGRKGKEGREGREGKEGRKGRKRRKGREGREGRERKEREGGGKTTSTRRVGWSGVEWWDGGVGLVHGAAMM